MICTNGNARRQPGADTSANYNENNSAAQGIGQRLKQLIVRLALWGLLPIPAADSLIRRLHLGGE